MKRSLLILSAGLMLAGSAFAQNPPAQSGPNNNAVNSSGQNNSDKPVAGHNSFTEGQAKTSAWILRATSSPDNTKDRNLGERL